MKLFAPFAKVDAEQRIVSGYASTEALDSQNEIVKREALERALPDYMKFGNIREMHQPSAVGVAVSATHDEKGLLLEAKIVDPLAWEKVKEGVYKGFSIGGRVTNRDPANKAIITGLHLMEISLVDRPANPEALLNVWKVDGVAAGDGMSKGMMAVSILANIVEQVRSLAEHSKIEEAKEGDTDSVVPGELQTALDQLMQTLNDMAAEETSEIANGTALECNPGMMPPLYLAASNVDVEKKDYSETERKDLVASGDAMADGSFPIKNRDDLENAVKAIGRAKDKAGAKAHIERRAKELGATDLIPDGWAEKADDLVDLEKKGRRNSASDQKKLNDAHDAIVAAGADCGAAKSAMTDDLGKARDDLAVAQSDFVKASSELAEAQGALAGLTKARDEAAEALDALSKTHEAALAERDDLSKRNETLVTDKAVLATENATLKAELEKLKAEPEPMKAKLLAIGKGEDVSTEKVVPATINPAKLADVQYGQWFGGRPA